MDAYEEAIETPFLLRAGIEISWIGIMQTIDFLPVRFARRRRCAMRPLPAPPLPSAPLPRVRKPRPPPPFPAPLLLPFQWCVKFVWAIPTDSYDFLGYGHRRPYVVMGLIVATVAFGSLGFFNPYLYSGGVYMALMVTRNIGIAVADCAVDGLSVDAEVDSESGTLQGWMSLGRTAGTVACCIVAGNVAKYFGYKWGIFASALFVIIPLPANWYIVEEWTDAKAYADKVEAAALLEARLGWKPRVPGTPAHGGPASPVSPIHIHRRKSVEGGTRRAGTRDGDSPGTRETSGAPTPTPEHTPPKEITAAAPTAGAASPKARSGGSPSLDFDDVPLPFPNAALPSAHPFVTPKKGGGGGGGDDDDEAEKGDAAVNSAARKLARRPSFVQRVAAAAGFDWDMLVELLRERHVWMFLLYICFTTLGVAVANFSLAAWLESDLGFEPDGIGYAMSAMSIGCFLFSLPIGYLFDAVPYKRSLLLLAAVACALGNLMLVFCVTELQAYWGLALFGAAHGAIFVVQCSMARILADSRIAGVLFGIVNSCCNSMHAIGTAITGFIVQRGNPTCEDRQNWNGTAVVKHNNNGRLLNSPGGGGGGGSEGVEKPFFCDYVYSFYIATYIDIVAILFVFLIPGDKLRVEEGNELKVLTHRKNAIFFEREKRATALNATYADLRSGALHRTIEEAHERAGADTARSVVSGSSAEAPTTEVSGVVMSENLAAFIANKKDAAAAAADLYVPPGGKAPLVPNGGLVANAALRGFGALPPAYKPDDSLASRLYKLATDDTADGSAAHTAPRPDAAAKPRRGSARDAPAVLAASFARAIGSSTTADIGAMDALPRFTLQPAPEARGGAGWGAAHDGAAQTFVNPLAGSLRGAAASRNPTDVEWK
jgi:MFS family permease